MLLVGVPGPTLDRETAFAFRRLQPGGFILFTRNIESPIQLRTLIGDLRDLSATEPLITLDQEGGRVPRLKAIGHEPPSASQLASRGDVELVRQHGRLTGQLLRLFGFNLDLCPVLDIAFDPEADNSLKGRCYGNSADEVIRMAGAFNDALRAERVASCAKHFPGYSSAEVDPHEKLPVIRRSRETLEQAEFLPFKELLPDCDAAMVGHAWLPAFDPTPENWPSSLSAELINGYLRNTLGFDGLVMTDDLDMGAMLEGLEFADVVRMSIEAGNDMAMLCHRLPLAEQARASFEYACV